MTPSTRTTDGSSPHQPTLVRTLAAALAGVVLAIAPLLPATATLDPIADSSGSTPEVASTVDRYMQTQMKESAIPGAAVALVRGDRVLLVRGYGHDSTGKEVSDTSLFRIASLSKAFTALAVMQLVEAGQLDLDDPVQEHLPEFQLDDPRAGQVTVRQLLDHTSGLTDAVVPEISRTQPRTPREATTSLRTAHLATAPGTSYSYHNPNYQVAARLVEVLSGETFAHYLTRHVLTPAGMGASRSTATGDHPVPGLARGHVTAYGHAFSAPDVGFFTTGDGGVVSTAADMARWLTVNATAGKSVDGTRLVSAAGMRTLHTPTAPDREYVLGWGVHGPLDGTGVPARLEHSGSLLTYTSEAAIWPRSGYGVVILFNAGSPMLLDQTAIVHGIFGIVERATPPAHGPTLATRLDMSLAVLTLTAFLGGASGVVRARCWAGRHRTRARRAFGLVPAVLVLAVTSAFPTLAAAWMGRDVTWLVAAYEWPALVVFVLTASLAAAATLISRTWQWTRVSRSAHHGSGAATTHPVERETALPVA